MFKQFLLGSAMALATVAAAAAADLPSEKGPPVYAPPPPPAFSWTGLYVGGNVGYAWGGFHETDLDGYNSTGETFGGHPSGITGGGQIGYNWQVSNIVFGVEASAGYMDLHRTTPQPSSPIDTFESLDGGLIATGTGRLGFTFDRALIYAKGGGAYYDGQRKITDACNTGACGGGLLFGSARGNIGWTVGGGVEYAFDPHWSARVEYDYYNLGDKTIDGFTPSGTLFRYSSRLTANAVTLGVNYKFDFFAPPAPVVAKY